MSLRICCKRVARLGLALQRHQGSDTRAKDRFIIVGALGVGRKVECLLWLLVADVKLSQPGSHTKVPRGGGPRALDPGNCLGDLVGLQHHVDQDRQGGLGRRRFVEHVAKQLLRLGIVSLHRQHAREVCLGRQEIGRLLADRGELGARPVQIEFRQQQQPVEVLHHGRVTLHVAQLLDDPSRPVEIAGGERGEEQRLTHHGLARRELQRALEIADRIGDVALAKSRRGQSGLQTDVLRRQGLGFLEHP